MISRTGTGGAAATTPPSPSATDNSARNRSRIPAINYIVPRTKAKRSPAEAGPPVYDLRAARRVAGRAAARVTGLGASAAGARLGRLLRARRTEGLETVRPAS